MGCDSRGSLPRSARRRLIAGLAGVLLTSTAGAQDDAARIVTHSAQGYSVDVAGTNLVQVLTEVGQVAGFTVEAPDHFNSPVNLTMQDVPLDHLLGRVLRNENYIIVYRGGVQKKAISSEQIDKIFLLSQAASGPAVKAPGSGSPLAGPAAAGNTAVGRGAPPPQPPPPPPPPGAEEGGDPATRAARARARADARRTAMGTAATAGGMPDAARMVQNPDDFIPHGNGGDGSHGDVPPVDVPPPEVDSDGDGIGDEY